MKTVDKWLIGAALAVAMPMLIPIIKNTARPLTQQGTVWAKQLLKQAQVLSVKAKHGLEDILVEAQYERMNKNWERNPYSYID